eukprot:588-Eustigmatos_ZCMA.PRE.1
MSQSIFIKQELGACVVLEKPDNPEEFLITKLKEVIEARKQKEAVSSHALFLLLRVSCMMDPET